MRYFDDMTEKYGFNDGAAIPEGIYEYRTVYLKILNFCLDRINSPVKMVAYDRPGLHNSVMILPASKQENEFISLEELSPQDLDAYHNAIEEARSVDADFFVEVTTRIWEDDLQAFLDTWDFSNTHDKRSDKGGY